MKHCQNLRGFNMKLLSQIREEFEIDFLKSCTYEEINKMFNELNDKNISLKKENEQLKSQIQAMEEEVVRVYKLTGEDLE